MINNSADKGSLTVRLKNEDGVARLCEIRITKGPGEEPFYVDYENGTIFINFSDGKDIIGTYETAPSSPYGSKVFDYPTNQLIGLVGGELIWFYKGSDSDRVITDGICLADYTGSGSIHLHGRPLDLFGLINGSEIGGAAAFVALFYNYKFVSVFRDYFEMDISAFKDKYAHLDF